jgi:hypothetical protein
MMLRVPVLFRVKPVFDVCSLDPAGRVLQRLRVDVAVLQKVSYLGVERKNNYFALTIPPNHFKTRTRNMSAFSTG